jgi:peptidoglycan/LPS O-acetylase OafA/YrhL
MSSIESKPDSAIKEVRPAASSHRHLMYLDGLRALAALYVVMDHASKYIDLRAYGSVESVLGLGHYAVNLFIVLSGFCLMLPVVQKNGFLPTSAVRFYWKRAVRILPPYFLSIVFALVLIHTLIGTPTGTKWDQSIPVTNWDLFTHFTLMQDVFPESVKKINYVLWSVSVEWRIYLFFPLLLFAWRKWGAQSTLLVVVLLSSAFWTVLFLQNPLMEKNGLNPHYFGLFAMGMLAAQISFSGAAPYEHLRKRWSWSWLLVLSATAVGLITKYGVELPWILQDLTVGIWALCLLVAVSTGQSGLVFRLLSWRPLAFVGTFAYSIYLLHAPLLQVLAQYVMAPLGLSPLTGLAFILSIGLFLIVGFSYLFFWCCERPFLLRKTRRRQAT